MKFISKNINIIVMVVSLLLITLVFSIMTNGIFLNARNISLLSRQTTVVGVLAIGMMFVLISGQIDLSVGSVLGLCGAVAAILQVWFYWSVIPVIIVTVLVGIVCGMWHGYWIAYKGVPSFIITLGGLLIFRGTKLGISRSTSIAPMNPSFSLLGQSYIPSLFGWLLALIAIIAVVLVSFNKRKSQLQYGFKIASTKKHIGYLLLISIGIILGLLYFNEYQGLPTPVLLMLIIGVIFSFLGNNTVLGRSIYVVGGNKEAALLSGINTKFITLIVFMISGGLAAIAGIILTARLDAATPAAGDGMELSAIAACVIGGTSLKGGVGKIWGVILGALIMASLDNGMSLINLENYWQFIVKGIVLTLAIWFDSATRKVSQ